MVMYAGIGSRKTPEHILEIMKLSAQILAKKGYTCNTGAAKGADQAFAEGACAGNGQVQLFIPWESYEKQWMGCLYGKVDTHVLNVNLHTDAYRSVYQFHPNPNNLSQGAIKLHARNYLIVNGVEFIICYTPNGNSQGGTGQAIRIARNTGITVYDLGNKHIQESFQNSINDARAEGLI